MNTTSYFKLLTEDVDCPCYFTHMKTHMLCYVNPAMEKLLEKTNLLQGNTCFEMLHGRNTFCASCVKSQTKRDFVNSYPLTIAGTCFMAHCSIIKHQDQEYMLSKYIPEELEEDFEDYTMTLSEAMAECADILTEHHLEQSLERFLSLLGTFHCCEQVYIYSLSAENHSLVCEYQWKESDQLKSIHRVDDGNLVNNVISWLQKYKRDGLTFVRLEEENIKEGSVESILYYTYAIRNLVSYPLRNQKGDLVGSIELMNLRSKVPDVKLLSAVGRFVEDSLFQKRMAEHLDIKANRDELTQFYNHARYIKDMKRLEEEESRPMGVLCANVNGLSKANIYFGVEASDIQIKRAAQLLKQFFPEDCYRLSGDDFVCFVPDIKEEEFTRRVKELQDNLKSGGLSIFSVGHAWRKNTYDMMKLVSMADTMLYINKQDYYNKTFGTELAPRQDDLLDDLLRGLVEDQFLVYFQPKVELATGLVTGAEALVRRFDPKVNKLVFPDTFIPQYEQQGIIRHIDLYVLEKVCAYLQEWEIHKKELTISVNLSRVTLLEHDISSTIAHICDSYEIPHHKIIIEVTERVGLIENEVASSLVDEFRSLDFKLSLDDFGCAYSNIVTLALINVDEVKLDKSLVDNLTSSTQNKIIVENVLNMVNQLEESATLAEGIEDLKQAETLKQFQCTYGQGYYYSRPIPADDFYHQFILPSEQVILRSK